LPKNKKWLPAKKSAPLMNRNLQGAL